MDLDEELGEAAETLLAAARAYYKVMQKKRISGGCIWLTDKDGAMVVFTRGEYKNQLLYNIETKFDADRAYNFGMADVDGQSGEETK